MPIPALIIKAAEFVVPPLLQLIVNHYSKVNITPETLDKLQAHKAALDCLKGAPNGSDSSSKPN